jgi:hypothetical protein
MRALVAFVAAAFLSCLAYADDSVEVSFDSGYPMPGTPFEQLSLSVVRRSGDDRKAEVEIDKLFLDIRQTLSAARIDRDWELMAIHMPAIRIVIRIGETKVTLAASTDGQRLVIPIDQTSDTRLRLKAMNAILALISRHTQRKLQMQ